MSHSFSLVATLSLSLLAQSSLAAVELEDLIFEGSGGSFGCAVAARADTLIIGASKDSEAGPMVGSVYIARLIDGTWSTEATLVPPNPTAHDHFGWAVALDGDALVVGTPHDDDAAGNCGAAYVYRRVNSTWTLEAKLVPGDGQAWDEFGKAVAISGETIIVGAHWDDDLGLNTGSAYVYRRINQLWTLEAKLVTPGGGAGAQLGISVAASGDFVVAGAYADDSAASNAGAAFVFRRELGAWTLEAELLASDATFNDSFGFAVAASGSSILVGAPDAGTGGFAPGAAYVYVQSDGAWVQQAKLMASDSLTGEEFGQSVALDGDVALIGVGSDNKGQLIAGAAYRFERDGAAWTEKVKMESSDVSLAADFAASLAIGDGYSIVGAPGAKSVYLFDLDSVPPLIGDADGDGCVGASDFGLVIASWGMPSSQLDYDGSGTVDGADVAIVLANWNGGC